MPFSFHSDILIYSIIYLAAMMGIRYFSIVILGYTLIEDGRGRENFSPVPFHFCILTTAFEGTLSKDRAQI